MPENPRTLPSSEQILLYLVPFLLLAPVACGSEDPDPVVPSDPPRPTTVLVTPSDSVIPVDDTLRLVAEVRDQNDEVIPDREVDWTSADPDVLTVTEGGLVTAVHPGAAEIYATAGDAEGSASVAVEIPFGVTGTLAVGGHACALDQAGLAYCWGGGSLGNGDSLPSELPTPVSGGERFIQISTVSSHSCGLTEDGRVLCWGWNRYGQVDPSSTESNVTTPTEVGVPGTVVQIAAGGEFSCALVDDGRSVCWGRNNEAQLGRGGTSDQEGPGEVAGDVDFRQIALGRAHACGLTGSGAAHCWGRNERTQLGDGTTAMASTPTPAATDVRFTQISASEEYSCAVGLDRHAYCWGHRSSGRLGNGSGSYDGRPVRVVDLEDVSRIDVGWYNACALDAQGAAHCWGGNHAGSLGTGNSESELLSTDRPLPVAGGLTFTEISVGVGVTCGRAPSESVYCWGSNLVGALGIGDSALELTPIEIPGGITWETVEAGGVFSCGVDGVGEGYCWGGGYSPNGEGPVALAGGHTFSDLSVGDRHACGITDTGSAYCWGYNASGQLGDGSNVAKSDPAPVATDSTFVDIDAGVGFTCAITASGQTYCWGDRNGYQMGDGESGGTTNVPVPGALGVSLTSITAGLRYGCGIDAANAAHCWGAPLAGEALGTGGSSEPFPATVSGGHLFESVEAGRRHTCGLDTTGEAWCWGGVGLMGTGSTSGSDVPVAVAGGMAFTDLGVGKRHTCAVETSGQVHCWGYGTFAEIGDGSFTTRLSPTPADLDPTAESVSAALLDPFNDRPASCAVHSDGRATCWGWNHRGQLGQPVIQSSTVPVAVAAFP